MLDERAPATRALPGPVPGPAFALLAVVLAAGSLVLAFSSLSPAPGFGGAAVGPEAPPAAPRRRNWLPRRAGDVLLKLAYGLVIAVLLGIVASLAMAVLPRAIGYGTLIVSGGSMESAIPNGSLVFVRPAAADDIREGDVLLVRDTSANGAAEPKLHRVVTLERVGGATVVTTKGDANSLPDPQTYTVPSHTHLAVAHVPYAGYLVSFLRTPLGWAMFVAAPAVAVAGWAVFGIWSAPRRKGAP